MEVLLLFFLAIGASGHKGRLPPPPPPPKYVASDLDELRRLSAAEESAALKRASRSNRNVRRIFVVGWEMHYGLSMELSEPVKIWTPAHRVAAEFADKELQGKMEDAASNPEILSRHLGQRLLCHCTGVAWTFHGEKHFLIRSITLVWE